MEYPKALMTIRELQAMGFSPKRLRAIAAEEKYPLVVRECIAKTSPIKFDTHELDKYLKRTTKMTERM